MKNMHWTLLVITATAIISLAAEWGRIFGTKKANPCVALKKREKTQTSWKEELIEKRSKSIDKDSITRYYDFEIDLAEGHLENISDSLKRLSCTE